MKAAVIVFALLMCLAENLAYLTSEMNLFPACRACDYVYIDYVRRSRSSSCHLLRPINCQTYITLLNITFFKGIRLITLSIWLSCLPSLESVPVYVCNLMHKCIQRICQHFVSCAGFILGL